MILNPKTKKQNCEAIKEGLLCENQRQMILNVYELKCTATKCMKEIQNYKMKLEETKLSQKFLFHYNNEMKQGKRNKNLQNCN